MLLRTPEEKKLKKVAHKIGHCDNCGWVHGATDRVRVEEDGVSVIKVLCHSCQTGRPREVVCQLCGRKPGNNLYPVPIERKRFDDYHTCNLFVHLCEECRRVPHSRIRDTFQVPDDICDSCADRFKCFTSKDNKVANSHRSTNSFHKGPQSG